MAKTSCDLLYRIDGPKLASQRDLHVLADQRIVMSGSFGMEFIDQIYIRRSTVSVWSEQAFGVHRVDWQLAYDKAIREIALGCGGMIYVGAEGNRYGDPDGVIRREALLSLEARPKEGDPTYDERVNWNFREHDPPSHDGIVGADTETDFKHWPRGYYFTCHTCQRVIPYGFSRCPWAEQGRSDCTHGFVYRWTTFFPATRNEPSKQ